MFMHFRCVITMCKMLCAGRIGLGWTYDVFNVACHMFMHFSCIHTNFCFYHLILSYLVLFCMSLSLFLSLVALWHLNENLLCPKTLFVLGHLLLLPPLILLFPMSGFVMIKPVRTFQRTSHDKAFIQNAKSFYRIFPILTFPLSSTVRVGSHYVASRSLFLP